MKLGDLTEHLDISNVESYIEFSYSCEGTDDSEVSPNNSQTLSSTQHTKQTDTLTEQHTTYNITLTTSQVQEALKQN